MYDARLRGGLRRKNPFFQRQFNHVGKPCALGNRQGKCEKITIYLDESNVYGSYIQGSEEAYVKNAIEKKFYEDTGNAVNIEILYCTHETFSNSFSGVMTTGRWDAAVSYLGQAGLEETVLNQDVAMDISDLVSAYGDHISEAVDQEAFYAVTTLTDEVIGVPSVVKTKTRGLLARKDYMTRVGYTESAEEAAASGRKSQALQNHRRFQRHAG